jgi:iron(II)-dependent oxidoreductase
MSKRIFIVLFFTLFQMHRGCIAQGIAEQKLRSAPSSIQAMAQIPAGEFTMGSNHGPDDEKPAHRIFLSSYSIDRYPVTNFQFAQFLNAVGPRNTNNERLFDDDDNDARIHLKDRLWQADIGFEDHPVVEVSWVGARDYCLWSGKKLPTEAQWEKAARGTDERKFPWGNTAPTQPTALYAQYAASFNDTVPVTISTKGASPYGVMDLVGNAWEWVSSAYKPYPFNSNDGRENPQAGPVRATRGGGHDSPLPEITTTQRCKNLSRNPAAGHHNIAFRCAK